MDHSFAPRPCASSHRPYIVCYSPGAVAFFSFSGLEAVTTRLSLASAAVAADPCRLMPRKKSKRGAHLAKANVNPRKDRQQADSDDGISDEYQQSMSSDSSDREEALCSDREEEQKRNRAREKKKLQREQQRERKTAPPPRLFSAFFARPVATPSAAATPAAATPAATTPAPLTAASPLTEPTDANVADAPDGVTNAASSMQSGDVATTTSPEPASLHCTICLDTLQASAVGNRACVTLPCTHTFHAECVLTFAMSDCRNHGCCPNC